MTAQLTLGQAKIGIVTALPKEYAAVRAVFAPTDSAQGASGTVYDLSQVPCIGGQIVVAMTQFLGMGNNLAAAHTTRMLADCNNIRDVVMVGIAGAIPCPKDVGRHVRLGDIVVSGPHGVFQFDLGKQVVDKPFEYRSIPTRPSAMLLSAIHRLISRDEINEHPWEPHIDRTAHALPDWRRPAADTDVLDDGKGTVPHPVDPKRRQGFPRLFVGAIASSNTLLKDAVKRDAIAAAIPDSGGVLCCVEMEGAGVQDATWLDNAGYLVVRGTCDYCNERKNDIWQKYGALIAAAFARSVIEELPSPPSSSSSPTTLTTGSQPVSSFGLVSSSTQVTIFNINAGNVHLQVDTKFGFPMNERRSSLEISGTGLRVIQTSPLELSGWLKEKYQQVMLAIRNACRTFTPRERMQRSGDLKDNVRRCLLDMRGALAVWNYEQAEKHATVFESLLARNTKNLSDQIVIDGTVLAARAHINRAETAGLHVASHIEHAHVLLRQAVERVGRSASERLDEILALEASVENLKKGPASAIALLEGRNDPYAIRARTALLLNQRKTGEAMRAVEGLDPHERWCDVAVTAYALNDQMAKAKAIVQWAASLSNRSHYAQCVVHLADAMIGRALVGHAQGANILPSEVSPPEREKLEAVVETIRPILQLIQAAGKPSSELDMAALQIAWRANHLLQNREMVAELMNIMSKWTPVPVDVARGVLSSYIEAQPDLPDRLRQDHPGDLNAGILAAVIQSGSFGRHKEAFAKAKELLPLADNNEKKEELFRLFQQVWQNIDGADATECTTIAGPLVAHNPKLRAILEGAVALRNMDADRAISILDGQESEDDIYWLQLRAHASLQKRQWAEAVNFLVTAAKKTREPELLHKTGDIAVQAGRHDVAVWCYESLMETQPHNLLVRGNLAHIYTFVLHDLEKAADQFRALHVAEPDKSIHTFNLAVCLAQLFRPEESLVLYDQLCAQETPSIQTVLGRAQLHHSMGRSVAALASLEPFRERFWGEPAFVLSYMSTAYAAGKEDTANDAMKALNSLREAGAVKPEMFRPVQGAEALEMFKRSFKETHDRNEYIHMQMLKGRMPWVWAEQMSNKAIYWGWRTRTQILEWIGDDPTNRAKFCIYSTNGFHACESEQERRELLPLVCPPPGTKVVADVSALITLHRLGLLDAAAEYFGEVLVPAGYLPTVLEDSRQMVLNQRSRQQSAEQITKQLNAGRILLLSEGAETASTMSIADEYAESAGHRYRLSDLVHSVHQAGIVSDADLARISHVYAQPSAVDEKHPVLVQFQDLIVDLATLETIEHFGLLDKLAGFYRIRITAQAQRELVQRIEAIAYQEETRQWHLDLWTRLRADVRFKFVPHTAPEQMRDKDKDTKDYLPFLASFIAQETKIPLMADDRVCQAFTLNEMVGVPHPAFGSDGVVLALLAAGKLDTCKAASAISQLMAWRYRFIVPTPAILKALADPYRENAPGQSLREVAEYVHDCMRDPGLFGGPEKTEMGDSMALRLYLTWMSTIADFLVLVWADESFTPVSATRLTEWSCRELLPSCPRVVEDRVKVHFALLSDRMFLSSALLKTANHFGDSRMADAMKAMKDALRLTDDEYTRIVTGILNDTARTTPGS